MTLLDTSGQASSTNIPLKAISELPIRGRNFTEFAQLTPAIIQATLAVDSRTDATILNVVTPNQALTVLPPGTRVPVQRIFGFDPAFKNPRTVQGALTFEQTVGGIVVSAGYVFADSRNLQRRLDRNLFAPTYNATGTPIYPATRPNPNFAQIEVNESKARSRYDALVLTSSQRAGVALVRVVVLVQRGASGTE